jgi:hypothetical protein
MPDLNLGPTEHRSPLNSILIAAAVLLAIFTALYFFTWHKIAEITVTRAEVFAPHTEFKQMPGAVHVLGAPPSAEDNVYIVATIRFTDKMRLPIFFSSASATMLDSTGAALEATVVPARDMPRMEASFPALTPMLTQPLVDGDEIAPGATREGTVLLLFPGITEDIWKAKKSATLTLNLAHQQPQTVPIP